MLYHSLKFLLINSLLLLSIWIIALHWDDEPKLQPEIQIIKIIPFSNGMNTQNCENIVPVKFELEQRAIPWLAVTNTTPRYTQLNYNNQKNQNCSKGEITNQYLVLYQYQGQQYQTVLNNQLSQDLPDTRQKKLENGYF